MQEREDKDCRQAEGQTEDEQVICSNQLLKAIRERMANRGKHHREEQSEEPE